MRLPFLFLCLMLATSCGEDPADPTPAVLVDVSPPEGSNILPDSVVMLTFDKDPGTVTNRETILEGSGNIRIVRMNYTAVIDAAWEGGQKRLLFFLIPVEWEPPRLTDSIPQNAATGVDPSDLIEQGIILEFTDRILSLERITVNDVEVKWRYEIAGTKITIWPDPGFRFEPGMNLFLILHNIVGPRHSKSDAGIEFQIKE